MIHLITLGLLKGLVVIADIFQCIFKLTKRALHAITMDSTEVDLIKRQLDLLTEVLGHQFPAQDNFGIRDAQYELRLRLSQRLGVIRSSRPAGISDPNGDSTGKSPGTSYDINTSDGRSTKTINVAGLIPLYSDTDDEPNPMINIAGLVIPQATLRRPSQDDHIHNIDHNKQEDTGADVPRGGVRPPRWHGHFRPRQDEPEVIFRPPFVSRSVRRTDPDAPLGVSDAPAPINSTLIEQVTDLKGPASQTTKQTDSDSDDSNESGSDEPYVEGDGGIGRDRNDFDPDEDPPYLDYPEGDGHANTALDQNDSVENVFEDIDTDASSSDEDFTSAGILKSESGESDSEESFVDADGLAEFEVDHGGLGVQQLDGSGLNLKDEVNDRTEVAPSPSDMDNDLNDNLRDCRICYDNVQRTRCIEAECGCVLCESCTKALFDHAINNESAFPPMCCDLDIPLETALVFLDESLVKRYYEAELEYSTTIRVYCAEPNCSAFIKPDYIDRENLALCGKCGTVTCVACRTVKHEGKCEIDEPTEEVLQLARNEKWQRCFRCRHLIEINTGCNHMHCPCGAEFCYVCAAPWKKCECPMMDDGEDFDNEVDIYEPGEPYFDEGLEQTSEEEEVFLPPELEQQYNDLFDYEHGFTEVDDAWIEHESINRPWPVSDYDYAHVPREPVVHIPVPFAEEQKICTHSFRQVFTSAVCQRCAWYTDYFVMVCRNCMVDVCSSCSTRLEHNNTAWQNPHLPISDTAEEGSSESALNGGEGSSSLRNIDPVLSSRDEQWDKLRKILTRKAEDYDVLFRESDQDNIN